MTNPVSKNIFTIDPCTTSATSFISDTFNTDGLKVNGPIILNGQDLEQRIATIEKVLGIPESPDELFKKYPKLKEKYDRYINELAKIRTWDKLKG